MQERVQLNISVTREQKLALQALAEGHGTSVTKLVLGLIDGGGVGSVRGPSSEARPVDGPVAGASAVATSKTPTPSEGGDGPSADLRPPRVIQSKEDARAAVEAFGPLVSRPADVSAAVERVVSVSPQARAFTPFSKEEQAGKVRSSKPVGKPETCRHGLLRCKVCGTG